MKNVIEKLNLLHGGNVLDVASGNGQFINFLMEYLASYDSFLGIDLRENPNAEKMFVGKPVSFQQMDAYKLQFPNETFDTVAISHSLHHFAEPEKILREMKRVLKKKGLFIINEMLSDDNQSKSQQSHIQLHHWFAKVDRIKGQFHRETYLKSEFKQIIQAIALQELEVYDYEIPVENPHDESLMKSYLSVIERVMEYSKNLPEEIVKEGDTIAAYLRQYGYSPAKMVLAFGKKF
jgi:ubiquinone/menaquinone biosynthesis C-methylase UbiE